LASYDNSLHAELEDVYSFFVQVIEEDLYFSGSLSDPLSLESDDPPRKRTARVSSPISPTVMAVTTAATPDENRSEEEVSRPRSKSNPLIGSFTANKQPRPRNQLLSKHDSLPIYLRLYPAITTADIIRVLSSPPLSPPPFILNQRKRWRMKWTNMVRIVSRPARNVSLTASSVPLLSRANSGGKMMVMRGEGRGVRGRGLGLNDHKRHLCQRYRIRRFGLRRLVIIGVEITGRRKMRVLIRPDLVCQ
jgi:hypothetical protein